MGLEELGAPVVASWQSDGTFALMQARILGIAEERGLMCWQYGSVDGSFSPWHRRR